MGMKYLKSVTQRISEVKQPKGGYINPKAFTVHMRNDGISLNPEENIKPILIGIVVDYLTRFIAGAAIEEAFQISLLGAKEIGEFENAVGYLKNIRGLDDLSIICACRLSGYDVCYRAGPWGYKAVQGITPDTNTIFNIRTMVNRSTLFLKEYGPLIKDHVTFEGGYTELVSFGDGDFLTEDTLWEFKVSKNAPISRYTLQLLIYYIMGCHSVHPEFKNVHKLGIFNPRLNTVYTLDVSSINPEIISEVSTVVIGYSEDRNSIGAINQGSLNSTRQKQNGNHSEKKTKVDNKNTVLKHDDWLLPDLISRYGVSRTKITGDFFAYGLPHWKEGQAYHFSPTEVKIWEIRQKYIPYGRNKTIQLPEYKKYKNYLESEIRKAKKAKNKKRVLELKQEAAKWEIRLFDNKGTLTIELIILLLSFIFIFMICTIFLYSIGH